MTIGALLVLSSVIAGCATCKCGTGDVLVKDGVLDIRDLAAALWSVETANAEGVAPPELEPARSIRLAVVEFTVEFVPDPTGSVLDFGTGMKLELPGILYDGFTRLLPEFKRNAMDLDEVTASEAYGNLAAEAPRTGENAPAQIRYTARGLQALEAGQEGRDAVLQQLIAELGADTAIEVRLRVGVRDGRASLEAGSGLRGINAEGASVRLDSKVTLVSPLEAVERDGDLVAVDSSRYLRAMERLFRTLIGTALVASGLGQ
jgi:hypothetical protein